MGELVGQGECALREGGQRGLHWAGKGEGGGVY